MSLLHCPSCNTLDIAYDDGDLSVGIPSGLVCLNEECGYVDFSDDDEQQWWDEVKQGLRELLKV